MPTQVVHNNTSLYNKYRPQSFSELVGQEDAVRILTESVKSGQMKHSMLFTGPRGTGKTTSARIVARSLLCENLQGVDPCGECSSCRYSQDANPGVVELDAGSRSSVADIRSLRDDILHGTAPTKNRVFIIDEVQQLTQQAFSAMLKTIEEPPKDAYIIMCTTHPQNLPETIRSRALTVPFGEVSDENLTHLVERVIAAENKEREEAGQGDNLIELSPESIEGVVIEGNGSPRDTLSVLDRVILGGSVAGAGFGMKLCGNIVRAELAKAILTISEAMQTGLSGSLLGLEAIGAMRDMMIYGQNDKLLRGGRVVQIQEVVGNMDMSVLSHRASLALPMLAKAHKLGAGGADPRAVLEADIIQHLTGSEDSAPSGAAPIMVMDRLSDIERSIESLSKQVKDDISAVSKSVAVPVPVASGALSVAQVDHEMVTKQSISTDSDADALPLAELRDAIVTVIANFLGEGGARARKLKGDSHPYYEVFIEENAKVCIKDKHGDWESGESYFLARALGTHGNLVRNSRVQFVDYEELDADPLRRSH